MTANRSVRPDIDSLLGGDFSRVRAAFARTVLELALEWDRRLGKARGGEQTLLAHALSVFDTLAACLPFAAEESYLPLTRLEVQGLFLAAFVHDAGKVSDAFQAYLRDEGPPVEHVEPETIRALAIAAAREAGIDLGDAVDDVVSQAVLHDRRMRRDRGELSEWARDHESLRWRKLADLVDAADSLASSTNASEAEAFLARNRQLVGGADVAAYQIRVRGVSSTFLHSAALEAFDAAGWVPLRYFEDGTVFAGRGAPRPDRDAVRQALEGKLKELISARAEQVAVLAVGTPTKDFLPSPEYVTEQNIGHLFDVAASRIRAKAKISDDERQRWTRQWVDCGLPEHEAVRDIFGKDLSDRPLEVLASSGPEICLLKLFKNLMDPAKGVCDSSDEETARKLYETFVQREGAYALMRQQSTYMLVNDYRLALAAWHWLRDDSARKSLRLADRDPKARQKRLRDELVRMTRAVFASRRGRGGSLPADRLVSEWTESILDDLSFERIGADADVVQRNLSAYAALKATGGRSDPKPGLQCAQCSDTIDEGAEEEPSDALGNIGSFSNRRIAFDTSGRPPICPTCTVDLKLGRLCLGGPVRTVIGLVPPRGFTPPEAAHLVERVQDLKQTLDRQLSPGTLDVTRYVALSLPEQMLRRDDDATLRDRLVLPVSQRNTMREREKRLSEALREKLGGDDGVTEIGREFGLPIASATDLAKALVEGTAPSALRDDPDVTAALRHAQRDALVEFAAVTPNLVIVALDREIAADRAADRALYQFGLATLFNQELGAAALVASPGELRTAIVSRLGRAAYVPSNGPARRLLGADWLPPEHALRWLRALQAAVALRAWVGGDAVGPYDVLRFPSAGFAIRRAELTGDAEPYWPMLWPHIEALKEVLG